MIVNSSPEEWQLIELPIEYFDERTPSSIDISFALFDSTTSNPASINSWVLIDNLSLDDITTGIEKDENIPFSFSLSQNYPNPFNPTTTIKYSIPNVERLPPANLVGHGAKSFYNSLPAFGVVQLKVYDLLGKEVATLVNEKQPAGSYEINFNASNLTSGVYLVRFNAGEYVQTRKITLMK